MSEVLGNPPSPRTALFWNGTAWQWALVDAAGHLQTDVVDAAGLQDALQSVATDRLIVRGEDQHFSVKDRLAVEREVVVSGADGYVDSDSPADGEYWIVTTVTGHLPARATTRMQMHNYDGITHVAINEETRAFAAGERCVWGGWTMLRHDDVIRVYFTGAQVGDTGYVDLTGYKMTVET